MLTYPQSDDASSYSQKKETKHQENESCTKSEQRGGHDFMSKLYIKKDTFFIGGLICTSFNLFFYVARN